MRFTILDGWLILQHIICVVIKYFIFKFFFFAFDETEHADKYNIYLFFFQWKTWKVHLFSKSSTCMNQRKYTIRPSETLVMNTIITHFCAIVNSLFLFGSSPLTELHSTVCISPLHTLYVQHFLFHTPQTAWGSLSCPRTGQHAEWGRLGSNRRLVEDTLFPLSHSCLMESGCIFQNQHIWPI